MNDILKCRNKRGIFPFLGLFIFLSCYFSFAQVLCADGIAMHGEPALQKDFQHFPYANPNAPQKGKVTYGVVGRFDGLNPFVLTGLRTTARGLFADTQFGNMVYETFMVRSADEPFTLYNLLAQHVELNDVRDKMIVVLNPKAQFSNGARVTADDVIFSYNLLKQHGRIPFNRYLNQIEAIEKRDDNTISYRFSASADRELPLIIASVIPVLSKDNVDIATFPRNGLTPILGTGPYLIHRVDSGERIVYKRNPQYWGKDLPVNRGINNYDEIQIEYYRNDNARFEAFKKGILDVFIEDDPNRWRLGYNFPAAQSGRVIKDSFKARTPASVNAFVFNTRRPMFRSLKVRQALSEVFDFEWVNKHLFNTMYQRTEGFWCNSELSSVGHPANDQERALLAEFSDRVLPEVMEGTWHPSQKDGSGSDRRAAGHAWSLLQQEGFRRVNNQVLGPDGLPFTFEIMTQTAGEEKIALAYKRSLQRLGINIAVRTTDDTQYQNRLGTFDYDVVLAKLSASISPGNEQIGRWSSSTRNLEGSFNYAGTHDIAIDSMIKAMLDARDKTSFVSAVRALDRLLISGHYMVPLYHLPEQWVARWAHIEHPEYTPLTGFRLPTWWRNTEMGKSK